MYQPPNYQPSPGQQQQQPVTFGPGSFSFNQYGQFGSDQAGQANPFLQLKQGGYSQAQLNEAKKSVTTNPNGVTTSPGAENLAKYRAFMMGPKMGQQFGQAALNDFMKAQGITDFENAQREGLRGGLESFIGGIADARTQLPGMVLEGGLQEADRLRDQAGTDYETFAKFRDEQVGATDKFLNRQTELAEESLKNFDSDRVDHMSAQAAGVTKNTQMQIQQFEQQAAASGMNPEAIAAQSAQMRFQGQQELQKQLAPLNVQLDQVRAQLTQNASQIYGNAANTRSGLGAALSGQTQQALQQRAQMATAAAQIGQSARLQSAQLNNQLAQLELAGYGQLASAMSNLPMMFTPMMDTLLQTVNSAKLAGGLPAINWNQL